MTDSSASTTWLPFGQARRAHGVRGELKISVATAEGVELLVPGLVLRVTFRNGGTCQLTITKVRPISDGFLVKCDEFSAREELQALAGASLEVASDMLPQSDAEEPYLFELIGALAVDEFGMELGCVKNVASTTSQDLVILEAPSGDERMLPLVHETFVAYDPGARTLTLRPIPGLWELTSDQELSK